MTTTLTLTDLHFHAFHGVMPQENVVGGEFVVDVTMTCDVSDDALKNDKLEGTVNYAEALELVKNEMRVPSKLIENVAYRMAQGLLERFPRIQSVSVKVTKVCPPWGMNGNAGVEIVVSRGIEAAILGH